MITNGRGLTVVLVSLLAATSIAAPVPGTVLWSFPGFLYYSAPAVAPDGTIYVGSDGVFSEPGLYAINPDGTQKWYCCTLPPSRFVYVHELSTPTIAPDGTIYVLTVTVYDETGTGIDILHAIAPEGTEKWSQPMPCSGALMPALAVSRDGTVYAGSRNGVLNAFYPDGRIRWQVAYAPDESLIEYLAIASDGTIYGFANAAYSHGNAALYAFSAEGSVKWSMPASAPHTASGIAIGSDGTVYTELCQSLYALRSDGTVRWSLPLAANLRSCPAIGVDGTIYIRLEDASAEYLAAVAPDGTLDWRLHLLDWQDSMVLPSGSPTVAADGTIYVGTHGDFFCAIGPNGTLEWQAPLGTVSTSPAIARDGTVYVSTGMGLFALAGSAPLANTPWPMAGHDPTHTFRATKPGDINWDGYVDVADLLSLVATWGLSFGQVGYDSRCDLDNSGTVDVVDLLTFVENWNK